MQIVASTNVYGDIAAKIAGTRGRVTSIISDPSTDPHSYEANARDQLAVNTADIVIENGGGYDDFMGRLRANAGDSAATVLDVVKISGKRAPAGGQLNEHVWYDFPTMERFTHALVAALAQRDPSSAATFEANGAEFIAGLHRLEASVRQVRAAHHGEAVAITEPVPWYLLEAMGLENRTPAAFSAAVEEGNDVSVALLKQTTDLFARHEVEMLVYNEQTSDPATVQVRKAARANDIPVVPVTETLPAGRTYLSWMTDNVRAIRGALG